MPIEELLGITVFQIEYEINESTYQTIGTGFFISNDGTFITAKHNIHLLSLEKYRIRFNGNTISSIYRLDGIDYSYNGIDIIVLRANIRLEKQNSIVLKSIVDLERLVGNRVQIIGYLNKGNKKLITESVLSNYSNNIFILQDGCKGTGISGSPVIDYDTKAVIGVVSKRTIEIEGFDLCYVYPFNSLQLVSNELYEKLTHNKTQTQLIQKEKENIQLILDYKELSSIYLANGNPIETFFIIDEFLQSNNSNQKQELFNLFPFYELAGKTLIHSKHSNTSSQLARKYLESSKNIILNSSFINDQILNDLARINWLIGNTYHQQKDYNKAYDQIYQTIVKYENILDKDKLVPMFRELSIIENSENGFVKLKGDIEEYKGNKIEVFHTLARTFEFYLKSKNHKEASKIYPNITKAFNAVHHALDKVYIVSFYKYLYVYHSLGNDMVRANKYYDIVFSYATKLDLKGQLNSLIKLKSIIET